MTVNLSCLGDKHMIDQSSDFGCQLIYSIAKKYNLPEFVKYAKSDKLIPDDEIPAFLYADPQNKLFPCHSKEATVISSALFFDQKYKSGDNKQLHNFIRDRLYNFGKIYHISHILSELEKKAKEINTVNDDILNSDKYYCLIKTDKNGKTRKYFPVRNEKEAKAAVDYFVKHKFDMSFGDRHKMASNLLSKINKYKTPISRDEKYQLEKSAGTGLASPFDAAELIMSRVELLKSSKISDKDVIINLTKMAESLAKSKEPYIDYDTSIKLAEMIDKLDEKYNFKNMYGGLIQSPEDKLFYITIDAIKKAADEAVELTNGSVYRKEDLLKIPQDELENVFGEEMLDSVTNGVSIDEEKLCDVLETLPKPDADKLDELAKKYGIERLTKSASASLVSNLNEESDDYLSAYHNVVTSSRLFWSDPSLFL